LQNSIYDIGKLADYKFVIIFAHYQNKWVFCRHKERTTWELPGGGIKHGETALESAKRELYEETGAIDFNIIPICDYYSSLSAAQIFFANIYNIGNLPESEIDTIKVFDTFPENLTYPEDKNELIPYVLDFINKMKEYT